MEEDYDYTMYTAVCTVDICPISQVITAYQTRNLTSEVFYFGRWFKFPLEFYYNKDNGNIIYGERMIYHYKQYPLPENYIHVPNFLESLYVSYQRSCNGELTTQDDKNLRSATTSFLSKVFSHLFFKKQAPTTQYAFILPSQKYTSKTFIDMTLRPLLQNTPLLTSADLTSKSVFYNKDDAYAYHINEDKTLGLCLERERKYLLCTLQRTSDPRRLMVTVRYSRAVYDPDLIAASGRSITALGGNIMLSLKLIRPSLAFYIPIEPTIAKVHTLAKLLYDKIFAADEEEDANSTLLEIYETDVNGADLIHQLIRAISDSSFKVEWSKKVDVDDFHERNWWLDNLFEKEKSRLSSITYESLIRIFSDLDLSSVEDKIERYMQDYGDEEAFESIVLVDEEGNDDRLAYKKFNPYNVRDLDFARVVSQGFYLLRVKNAIIYLLEKQKKSRRTRGVSIWPGTLTDGYVFKIWNITQLSSRLGRPIVMKPVGEIKQGTSSKVPAIQEDKLALIAKIQPYGYYVEANFSCSGEIKMYMNQVIETTSENGKLQRSTLSIKNSSYQVSDMYDSIFNSLWNIIDGHLTNPQCKSFQEDGPTPFDRYNKIREDLIDAIKYNIESKLNALQDLDEVIYLYNANLNCTCDLIITHRLVMNTGLLPYLRRIACEIVAPLKSNAMFGDYKVSCLSMTGEFLSKWLEQGSATYGELIWNQLLEAISAELHNKQLRIHLMMKKSVVQEDKTLNYKLSKLETYTQVFSKHFALEIQSERQRSLRVYRDGGDHWVQVPITSRFAATREALIFPKDEDEYRRPLWRETFYVITNPKETDGLTLNIKLYVLTKEQVENLEAVLPSSTDIALFMLFDSLGVVQPRCGFPVEVDISPCSYLSVNDIKLRFGVGAEWSDPMRYERVAYSERLTLQKLNPE